MKKLKERNYKLVVTENGFMVYPEQNYGMGYYTFHTKKEFITFLFNNLPDDDRGEK